MVAERGARWRTALAIALTLACALVRPARAQSEVLTAPDARARPERGETLDLRRRLKDVHVERSGDQVYVKLDTPDGTVRMRGADFLERIEAAQVTRDAHGWLFRAFNITTHWGVLWVGLGFAGQALFALRMLLQWWASEREQRSVVPIGFWWGSLFGGLMLFAYFVWRKDIVGIVGQSTGVFVYARNLVLIHRARAAPSESALTDARTA
jgi:lipid-A-disaccharide synthase-like uncharacterized protein